MPRVSTESKDKLTDKELKDFENELYSILNFNSKNNTLPIFLSIFLTDEERLMLSKRLQLLKLVSKDYSENEIKQMLVVSYETARSYKIRWEFQPDFYKKIIRSFFRKNN